MGTILAHILLSVAKDGNLRKNKIFLSSKNRLNESNSNWSTSPDLLQRTASVHSSSNHAHTKVLLLGCQVIFRILLLFLLSFLLKLLLLMFLFLLLFLLRLLLIPNPSDRSGRTESYSKAWTSTDPVKGILWPSGNGTCQAYIFWLIYKLVKSKEENKTKYVVKLMTAFRYDQN